MDWVTMRHKVTEGITRVPDSADVLAVHEAKGWVRVEPDAAPPPPVVVTAGVKWVRMRHLEHGGVQELPNDQAVLAEAMTRGWVVDVPAPEMTAEPAVQEQEAEPAAVGDTKRKGTSRG
jgi:hypothetical protein